VRPVLASIRPVDGGRNRGKYQPSGCILKTGTNPVPTLVFVRYDRIH